MGQQIEKSNCIKNSTAFVVAAAVFKMGEIMALSVSRQEGSGREGETEHAGEAVGAMSLSHQEGMKPTAQMYGWPQERTVYLNREKERFGTDAGYWVHVG